MGHTRQKWTMDKGSIDFQLFIGANKFADIGTHTAIAYPSAGVIERTIAASNAAVLVADLATFLRTGEYATPNNSQRQFGTAASQPGPSAVARTSDPLAIVGFPPYLNSANPTLFPSSGPVAKGLKINWVDIIYSVAAVNLSAATMGLTITQFLNNTAAATVTNIITLGANGLPTTFRTNLYRTRVTPAAPAYQTLDGSEILLNVNLTTPAGGTAIFYGAVIGSEVNYN